MIDKDVVRIAEELLRVENEEQKANILQQIKSEQAKAASRGLGRSGAYLNSITNICAVSIKNKAQLVWQTFFRFLTTTGISYSETLAAELKLLVANHFPENCDLKDLVKQQAELIGLSRLFPQFEGQIDSAKKAALVRVGTEIDLFVYSIKRRSEMKEKEANSTIFNIYSPVGAIQTGDSSIANVTQNIDAEVREQLGNVLEEIYLRLAQEDIVLPHPKKEIIEIVQEGQEKLKKQSPNITKLRGMLSAVGTAIQSIASMQPAYEGLKQALTFLGISLP